jgi:flagellar biosynthesis protein FlhB
MADDQESQTEAPSQRRLDRALEEGQIVLSRDVGGWATLAAAFTALATQGEALQRGLTHLFQMSAGGLDHLSFEGLFKAAIPFAMRAFSVCVAIALGAATAGLIQTRGQFWFELAGPRLERLMSGGGFRRIFGGEAFVDLAISTVKVLALATAMWVAVRDDFLTLSRLPAADVVTEAHKTANLLGSLVSRALLVMGIFAGTDFALSYLRHRRKLRMTKDEIKRESKQEDGDPLLRHRRRRKHRELAKAHARVMVPKADALIVNPTHIAIAIRYQRGEDRAPRVIAKGKGFLAEGMRELAREHNIPIVEDIPLARLLWRKVRVGGEVPAQTYKAVAAILAFVYRVTGRARAGSAR